MLTVLALVHGALLAPGPLLPATLRARGSGPLLPATPRARGPVCAVDLEGIASDVLLHVQLATLDAPALQAWLCTVPYSLALPVQPMVWLPVAGPPLGVELSFRRKPSDEKGGIDGGVRFTISSSVEEGGGSLLLTRTSEGQYVAKVFSERAIVKLILSEMERMPADVATMAAVLRP